MIAAALEELDLSAVLAALREQEEKHGHSAATDAGLPVWHFANELTRRAVETADVIRPGDRQNLDVAYRRAARLGAFAVAAMRRIRIEQQGAPINDQR